MNTDYNEVTQKHIDRVGELLEDFIGELTQRAQAHDRSKFTKEEMVPLQKLQEVVDREGQVPFNSPEYDERKKLLKPMLDHHYKMNSHHPEHYDNGIDGMSLGDIVEMFFDWKAASERGGESTMKLSHAADKYNMSSQLLNIFMNTCNERGYKYE